MKAASKSTTTDNAQDAIVLLTDDHKTVQKLFKDYEKLTKNDADDDEKAALATQICMELTIHAQIEEEIFYPAVREAIEETDLLDEAEVEHAGAKDLIAQIGAMTPGEELYDAKVTVLGEYVNHHIKEEQDAIDGADAATRAFLLADFHVCLAECLGHRLLSDMLRDLTARTTLVASLYQSTHDARSSCADHAQIVAAIERGQLDNAAALMLDHIGSVEAALGQSTLGSADTRERLRASLAPVPHRTARAAE